MIVIAKSCHRNQITFSLTIFFHYSTWYKKKENTQKTYYNCKNPSRFIFMPLWLRPSLTSLLSKSEVTSPYQAFKNAIFSLKTCLHNYRQKQNKYGGDYHVAITFKYQNVKLRLFTLIFIYLLSNSNRTITISSCHAKTCKFIFNYRADSSL